MKKLVVLCITLSLSALPVFSQTSGPSPDASAWEINGVSFGTALIPFLGATLAQQILVNPDNSDPVWAIASDSLYLTSLVPLFITNTDRAWSNLGVQGQFYLYTSASRLLFGNEFLVTNLFDQGLIDFTFINAYYTYRSYRDTSNDPVYSRRGVTSDWTELMFTPFINPQVFANPLVWGVPLGVAGLWAAYHFLFVDSSAAVWNTGQAYFEDQPAPIWAAGLGSAAYWGLISLMVGTSEEMLFRGYIYDEISYRFGLWVAKGFDIVFFSLIHIPIDMMQGRPWEEIAFLTAIRLAGTLGLDFAYDAGGLPYSMTLHATGDFLSNLFLWFFTAGSPRSEVKSRVPFDLTMMPTAAGLRFGFELTF